MLPEVLTLNFYGEGDKEIDSIRVFYATIVGLFVGGTISSVTEYYTGLVQNQYWLSLQNHQLGWDVT